MLNGKASEFDFNWYLNVGSAIVFTMAINGVSVHASPLIGYLVVAPLQRCFASASATQRKLNKKFEGPEFEVRTGARTGISDKKATVTLEWWGYSQPFVASLLEPVTVFVTSLLAP